MLCSSGPPLELKTLTVHYKPASLLRFIVHCPGAPAHPSRNERREGEGQTEQQEMEMVLVTCVRSSVPFPSPSAFPRVGPSSRGAKQAKQSKAKQTMQNCRPHMEACRTQAAFSAPCLSTTLSMLLNFFTQLPEFIWKGNWSLSPFPWIPISPEKSKDLWSNKIGIFPQTVLKYAYKQHCRKEGKISMHKSWLNYFVSQL